MIHIAHIVNPFKAEVDSEAFALQSITYESMYRAKEFANGKVAVELFSVSFSEDQDSIPSFFTKLPDLKRSVLDAADFTVKRKLPLIADILKSLFENGKADWLIYTNTDIALMPNFYESVAAYITEGYDSILINRRRISKQYNRMEQLPLMYAELGSSHPGYDCFVFHRSLFSQLILDEICIGIPFIEVSMLHNFIAFSKKLKHVDDKHLTFHIGMEVMPPIVQEYYWHNRKVYEQKIRPILLPLLKLEKFPYSTLPFYKRMFKWMLNPCYSSTLLLELEGKSFFRKVKISLDEFRWRILSK